MMLDPRTVLALFALFYLIALITIGNAAPAKVQDPNAHPNQPSLVDLENPEEIENKVDQQIDDLGLEYGRYLQQVVEALEQDKEFAKKLENVSHEDIKSGRIAKELNYVSHNVRTRLDELKRVELDRLRELARKKHDQEQGIETDSEGRRWRTLGGERVQIEADHLHHQNPHSFEAEDLQKLILAATNDLDKLDKKRQEDFKKYEMEKELQYRDSLQNKTKEQQEEMQRKHDESQKKHREHPRVHHPGSKQQLEQVWEQQDHMPREEFNPKVFFSMHDVNGDGFLDQQEVEALLTLEIKKMYDEKNPEDDPNEMMEEYHRMREHIYREADTNRDGLISKKEFLDFTSRIEFEKDEAGWKGIDESQVYTQEELHKYELERQKLLAQYQQYGAYQAPYYPAYQAQYDPRFQQYGAYPGGYDPNHQVPYNQGNQLHYDPSHQPQFNPGQQMHYDPRQVAYDPSHKAPNQYGHQIPNHPNQQAPQQIAQHPPNQLGHQAASQQQPPNQFGHPVPNNPNQQAPNQFGQQHPNNPNQQIPNQFGQQHPNNPNQQAPHQFGHQVPNQQAPNNPSHQAPNGPRH